MRTKGTRKKDIRTPGDIRHIVESFFEKLKVDIVLGPYFTGFQTSDWKSFSDVMSSFWENILFQSGGYYGNPMQRHKELNAMHSFTTDHFRHWLALFCETVDECNNGEKADIMKEKAGNIATIMQVKMLQ